MPAANGLRLMSAQKNKQAEHERNRAEIINRQRGDRRGAQQMRGLFDQIESAFALLPPAWISFLIHPMHLPERSFVERCRNFQQAFADRKKKNQAIKMPSEHWASRRIV